MADVAQRTPAGSIARGTARRFAPGRYGVTAIALGVALIAWTIGAHFTSPFFFPSPLAVAQSVVDLRPGGVLPPAGPSS